MPGIDSRTGAVIDNYASALQSVEFIFSTELGSLVGFRELGAGLIELLGRRMSARLFIIFRLLLKTAIDAFEQRFVVRRVDVRGTVDGVRLGEARFAIEVDWRPGAYADPPDYRVESVRTFGLSFFDRGVVTEILRVNP